MDKIVLMSSAALGFVVGAVYAAVAKICLQAGKAMINANQPVLQADKSRTEARQASSERISQKAKLPARIK